ncbi:MAG: ATP-binding protein [Chloroflexota bacterium]
MLPSQTEFESLIQRLQSQKTELAEIDAKENLFLSTDGDKAFFIHHIAALANNVIPSYLIIGIEDKSWKIKGLSSGAPLMNSDQTQNRMNQILEKRLDPQLAIRYRTYDYQGKTLGLVSVEGNRAPYLIAIDDDRYGGNRTKGEPCYIFRGAIFVRHGDSTVIVNRQGRILEILDQSKEKGSNGPDEFFLKNNYIDVDAEDYGKNSLTDNLVEILRSTKPGTIDEANPAKSWVSFVFNPMGRDVKLDTVALRDKLQPDKRIGRDGEWYHGLPRPISDMLFYAKGTPKSYGGTWFPGEYGLPTKYTHAISILPTGHIQVIVTRPLFCVRDGIRFYAFVSLIGYFWQLLYLARAVYRDAGIHGETLILINLIGSSDTFLADFARWYSIFDWEYSASPQDQVQEKSICIKRQFNLVDANDNEIEALCRGVADEVGKYYGQQRPKCFTPDTNMFPMNDYVSKNYR